MPSVPHNRSGSARLGCLSRKEDVELGKVRKRWIVFQLEVSITHQGFIFGCSFFCPRLSCVPDSMLFTILIGLIWNYIRSSLFLTHPS